MNIPPNAHPCARQQCTDPVRQWADQFVMDVVSIAGKHTFYFHVECWKAEGATVEPQPGVAVHVRRPTLHPTMRHRRDQSGRFAARDLREPIGEELAQVITLQARGPQPLTVVVQP